MFLKPPAKLGKRPLAAGSLTVDVVLASETGGKK